MKRNLLVITFTCFLFFLSHVKASEYPVNASVFYPISINQSIKDTVYCNLGLFYSRYGTLKGYDYTFLASLTEDRVSGVQISNIICFNKGELKGAQISNSLTMNRGRVKGAQISGIATICGNNVKGAQLAGVVNIGWVNFKGVQAAGLLNITFNSEEEFDADEVESMLNGKRLKKDFTRYFFMNKKKYNKGAQLAGAVNISFGRFKGLQAAGGVNFSKGDFTGAQLGGGANVSGGRVTGCQAGLINISDVVKGCQMGLFNFDRKFRGLSVGYFNLIRDCEGIQLGLINMDKRFKGLQIGLINIVERHEGFPIGLILISQDSKVYKMLWGSNLTGVNTGLVFMVNGFYSIVYIGRLNVERDVSESLSRGFFYGKEWNWKKTYYSIDCGYTYIDNYKLFSNKENRDQNILLGRFTFGVKVKKYFSLFTGVGFGYVSNTSTEMREGDYHYHFFGGIRIN